MPTINGWQIQGQKARAQLDGWTITAECITWEMFTHEVQRTEEREKRQGVRADIQVIRFRALGQLPQPQDAGMFVTANRDTGQTKQRFFLPSAEESQQPGLRPFLHEITPRAALEQAETFINSLPLSTWQVDEANATARSAGMGIAVEVRHLTYAQFVQDEFRRKDLDRGDQRPTTEELQQMIGNDDRDNPRMVFTMVVTTDGEDAARTMVLEQQAGASSITAFTRLHRPADIVKNAASSFLNPLAGAPAPGDFP